MRRRCAIVSGGSRGIGRAVAIQLARDGYDIAFCYRGNTEAAAQTAVGIADAGGRSHHAPVDVADHGAVREFIASAETILGPPHVVVSCAGVVDDRALMLMDDDQWSSVVDTNLTGTYHLCRSTVTGLVKRHAGVIVNIASIAGLTGRAGQTNYSASKAGIIALTTALAKEVGPFGVRANVLAPGFIDSDMVADLPEKARRQAMASIPLRRFGDPQHVADGVSFLVSDRASYVNGAVLRIDGGITV